MFFWNNQTLVVPDLLRYWIKLVAFDYPPGLTLVQVT